MQEIDIRYTAKIPVQARSKSRFNKILAITEELVLEIGPDEVSPHKIAKRADIPAGSVYQYFPTMGALYSTMAEIHFVKAFDMASEKISHESTLSWQELTQIFIDVGYDFYTKDKISEILFLGAFSAPGVRELSGIRLTRVGHWFSEKYSLRYKNANLQPLAEKLSICIEVMKGVYIRSLSIHGKIEPQYKKEVEILIDAYLGEFFLSLES